MRRMFRRSNAGSIDSTPESRYARIKTAGWLMRLFDKRIVLSSELFTCTSWCLGGLDFCLQGLIKEAASYTPVSKNEDEMAALEELKRVSLYNLGNALDDFLQEHPRHHKSVRALLQKECREMHSTRMKRPRSFAMAAKRLEELFGLDRESVDLCEFLFINRSFEPVESYFEDSLQAMRFGGIDFLAHMLGLTASRCRDILRELVYLGIAEGDRRHVALEDSIRDLWTESDSMRVSESFCRPLEGEALPLENFSIPAEQVEHVRALLRQPSDRPLHILLYGAPGTGKTALARYLADRLDRECKVVRASDLLGSYIGMTEANIAEAFRDAERDDAVLVIDEADSFLFPREKAHRSWETTMVNEFLTALEECRGFCICTTNRRENMDQAVMRRFSHKIAFTYSKPEQVQALYDALLAPLASELMSKELETELLAMRRLTPGDFHAVRSRMLFDGGKDVKHHVILEGLRQEQELKLDIDRRGMGFLK